MPLPIKFTKKEEVAKGTKAFYFTRPEGFEYQAGQSIDLTVGGVTNAFSLTSAPYEPFLSIATRMRDTDFKRSLDALNAESELAIEGPFGSMTLHNDVSKPAVFLCGGIGITPFYSLAKNAAHEKAPHKIFLFYSNRTREDAAFIDELEELQNINPNFKLINIFTSTYGHLGKDNVLKYVPDIGSAIGYIAGPSAMMKSMRTLLNEAGLNDDYIRSEEFSGY